MRENENLSVGLPVRPESAGGLRTRMRRRLLRQEASRNRLRLDFLPPSGSGMNASKKLELPPTRKDDLKAPGKKTGTPVKKEKPKHMPPKVKGAELWRDCPAEFLLAAKRGLVSGRLSIQSPGPGLLLKEVTQEPFIMEAEEDPAIPEKPARPGIDSSPRKISNTPSKQSRTFSKPKGKKK